MTTLREKYLREILSRTATQAYLPPVGGEPERLPLPMADQRKSGTPGPVTEILAELDTVPALKSAEVSALRTYLSLPRPEFLELPNEAPLVRLRAIEELARMQRGAGSAEAWVKEVAAFKSPRRKALGAALCRGGKSLPRAARPGDERPLHPRSQLLPCLAQPALRRHGRGHALVHPNRCGHRNPRSPPAHAPRRLRHPR
jgi:hypothetical protein